MQSIPTSQLPPALSELYNYKDKCTSCERCVFAQMENDIQSGCAVRNMESYSQTDKYRIINRMCHFKRLSPWQGTVEDLFREIRIAYNAIIEWTNRDEVQATIDSLLEQEIQPRKIIVVCYQRNGEEAFNLIKDCPIEWTITEIVDDLVDWRDDIILKHPVQFYTFIKAGYTLPNTYFSSLNDNIHRGDLRFGAIHSDNLLIIPHGMYTMVIKPLRYILEEMFLTGAKTLNEDFSTKE